jgi:glycosyltransferase involved in cell wall biosynthesis
MTEPLNGAPLAILHVLSTPRAEGTPNLVLDWLSFSCYRQDVLVLNRTPSDLTHNLESLASWYEEKSLFTLSRLRKFLGIILAIFQACRDRRPQLLICWPNGFALWVCLGARLAQRRNIQLIVHCGNPPRRGNKADWLTRFNLVPVWAMGAHCICCSNYVRDSFRAIRGMPKSLFQTVYNCARISEIKERATSAKTIPHRERIGIMVGTLEAHKDHGTVLRAMPEILAGCPNFQLRFVGDGSLRAGLERLADDLNVNSAVEFLGSRTDIAELMGSSDIFVFSTTEQEGFGTVLIEALAAGLPVVATNCAACREVLADGAYGILVEPNNPSAWAKQILAVLDQQSPAIDRHTLSSYLARFTIQRMMSGYLQLRQTDGPSGHDWRI